MVMERKIECKKVIFSFLSISLVAFIFTQSCLPASKSSAESGFVLSVLNSISEFFGLGSVFDGHAVRKLAHFLEFSVLSGVLFFTYKLFFKKLCTAYIITVTTYLSVAVIDECIQLFSEGRSCQLTDVLIDFSGGTVALLFILIIHFVFRFRKFN